MTTTYKLRFIKADQVDELINLFHLARVPLSKTGDSRNKYKCKLWACKEFSKAHPETTPTAAYKDLETILHGN